MGIFRRNLLLGLVSNLNGVHSVYASGIFGVHKIRPGVQVYTVYSLKAPLQAETHIKDSVVYPVRSHGSAVGLYILIDCSKNVVIFKGVLFVT